MAALAPAAGCCREGSGSEARHRVVSTTRREACRRLRPPPRSVRRGSVLRNGGSGVADDVAGGEVEGVLVDDVESRVRIEMECEAEFDGAEVESRDPVAGLGVAEGGEGQY